LQRLDQARGLHRGDQRRVILRVDGVLDDVLVGRHRRAAHHRILGKGNAGEHSRGKSAGSQRSEDFAHVSSPVMSSSL
jgi:hypothetical protein